MAFKKITRNVENIQTLPDKPYLDAQVLKAEFDKGNKIIKEDFNELSGELDQYSSYVNSAYSPKARKNIVVGDELQNETLYFDFGSLTYSDLHSDAYLIYVDDNHYIKTTLKSATEAGIILKDGNIFKTLFTITNEDVISVNQTYYTFSSSCGNVVEVNSSYIEYTKCYINDEDKTLTNLANIQSIGDNLTLSNSGRLDATGGGGSVDIDDSSITKNTDDEIQTSGVIDSKTSATNKFWTGTLAEYNAITTKDSNTFYHITDDYNVSSDLPSGGTTGQVLSKNSNTDYDVKWSTVNIPTKLSDLTNDLPTVDMVIYFDDDTSTTYNIYGKTDDNITIDDQEVTKVTFDGITLFEKEEPTPTQEYVQDGLVAWYDAENNTGNGHTASTSQWKNLAGNDYAQTPSQSTMTFEDNYISFTANSTPVPNFSFTNPQTAMTLEIVCVATSPIGSSQAPLLSNFSGLGYGIQNASFTSGIGFTINNGSWRDMNIVSTSNWNTSKIYTITAVYDGTAMKGYADGELTNSFSTSGNMNSDYSTLRIFGANTSNNCLLSGKVYCVRCYNKALTAEEVAQNRALDLERFGT